MGLSDYIGKYWASAEIMYAVIIAITFTSTLRDYNALSGMYYQTIVYAAFFCCLAWGIADGLFYAWEERYITNTENKIIKASKLPENNEVSVSLVRDELDDTILRNVNKKNREEFYQLLVKHLAEVEIRGKPSTRDSLNIVLNTFLISTAAGFIVVFPFFLIDDLGTALYVSNLLGISLLFIIGFYRAQGRSLSAKVMTGFGTAIIGIIVAVITTLLGG